MAIPFIGAGYHTPSGYPGAASGGSDLHSGSAILQETGVADSGPYFLLESGSGVVLMES